MPRPTIKYGYHPGATTYNDVLELGTNLVSITDPNEVATGGPPRLKVTYGTSGNDRDKVLREDWPTGEFGTFTYTSPTQVETKDVLGQVRSYTLAGSGRDARVTALVERQVPTSTTPVGQLPTTITAMTVPTALQDRTWQFEYDSMGLLHKRTLTGVAATEYSYQPPAGAPGFVLASATTTPLASSPGVTPITRAFTYQSVANGSTFLQSSAANGLTVEAPEPHRNKLEAQATNNSVTSTEKFDIYGRLTEFVSTGGTDSGAVGASLKIKYRPDAAPLFARGEIEEVTRGELTTKFDYPTADRTIMTDPREIVTTTDYDEWRRPVHVTTVGPGISSDEKFYYDATGHMVRTERRHEGENVTTSFGFDPVGRLTRETSDHHAVNGTPSSLIKMTTYDSANRKIITTLPSGATITKELDSFGRAQREVIATGGDPIEYRYAYDLAGNQVFDSDLLTATARAFDAYGREIATLHPDGTRDTRVFDARNHVTRTTKLNASGSAIVGERTQVFTPAGRLQSITTKIDASTNRTTDFEWDGGGRRTVVDVSGRASRMTFDASGRPLSFVAGVATAGSITTPFLSTSFLAHTGVLPVQIASSEKTAAPVALSRQYDSHANVTAMTVGGLAWQQTFDETGNLTTVTLPQRAPTTFVRDGHGALTQASLPDGAVNQFAYDASGALDKYLDPVTQPTAIEADRIGRPAKRTYPDGTTEVLTYEGRRLKTFTDRQGRTRVFTYNGKGQLTRIDRLGGGQLDQIDYDDAGRLIRWTNKDSSLFYTDFDFGNQPRKTITTQFRNGSGFATPPELVGAFIQEHKWNEHGERVEWTMPRTDSFTATMPWTDRIHATYDAMGNLATLERTLFSGVAISPFFAADYRNAGRPNIRTLKTTCGSTPCVPTDIVRKYSYDSSTGLLRELAVTVGPLTVAGSRITAFDGLQIQQAQLLGISDGSRVNQWSYDARSRLQTATIGRDVTQNLTPADFRSTLVRTPRFDAPTRSALAAKGVDVQRLDPPSQTATEEPAHKVSTVSDGTTVRAYSYNGSERKDDGKFEYDWDEKGRLVRATEKPTIGGQAIITRVTYTHDGNDRMIGRRVETALTASTPLNWQLASPYLLTDGLPADATFIWDPITDQIAAVFDATTGTLVRQIIHGGGAYDDPLEVTLLEPNNAAALNRLYPIYDEAAAGHLEAILNVDGEVVSRKVVADAYGDDAFSIAGAAIDHIVLHAKNNSAGSLASIDVTVRATEELQPTSVSSGLRIAALDADGKVVRISPVPAVVSTGSTARITLTASDWTALIAGASSLSIGVTATLRAAAWSGGLPILPPPEWARATRPVFSSPTLPVEIRESLANISEWLGTVSPGTEASTTLYEVSDIAIAGSDVITDDPARFLVSSYFHALPFMDSVTRLSLARSRWLDHHTGTFLTPDPFGYHDSPNLYSFCGGDPVNQRDPTGKVIVFDGKDPMRAFRTLQGGLSNPKSAAMLNVLHGTDKRDYLGFQPGVTKQQFFAAAIPPWPYFDQNQTDLGMPLSHDRRSIEEKVFALMSAMRIVHVQVEPGAFVKFRPTFPFNLTRDEAIARVASTRYGGGATSYHEETPDGDIYVGVDPDWIAQAGAGLARIYGVKAFDSEITLMHELGHALADVEDMGMYDRPGADCRAAWSVRLENQIRDRRGEHSGLRTHEVPLLKDPRLLECDESKLAQ
ncbi:MAG: RHS repeat protein [Thermoanaerobaculia bacterium]